MSFNARRSKLEQGLRPRSPAEQAVLDRWREVRDLVEADPQVRGLQAAIRCRMEAAGLLKRYEAETTASGTVRVLLSDREAAGLARELARRVEDLRDAAEGAAGEAKPWT